MLYHYSEEPSIAQFIPRPIADQPDSPSLVWAIDEKHAVNYWFPRECPRIIYRRSSQVSREDAIRFFTSAEVDTVMAVESRWLDRIRSTILYEYAFEDKGFKLRDRSAGYYVADASVKPLAVKRLDDLMGLILSRNHVELRLLPDLRPLKESVLSSSIDHFSIIRFRNAGTKANSD